MAELWADYLRFHQLSLETRDVDPVYPVLKAILRLEGLEPDSEEGLWLSVHHLTWYHMGSALRYWDRWSQGPVSAEQLLKMGLPCATERRGNRDPKQLIANLGSWVRLSNGAGGLKAMLTEGLASEPQAAWSQVMSRIELVHGNGRWASYKLAEILIKVNGLKLEPWNMGHANSSGPRRGLELLYDGLPQGNSPMDVAVLDKQSRILVEKIGEAGLPAPVEETETTLCDFHALHAGRYYVGNDIDQMLEQLLAQPGGLTDSALQGRFDTLPHAYLGELNGWNRVDRDRQRAYKNTGEILVR